MVFGSTPTVILYIRYMDIASTNQGASAWILELLIPLMGTYNKGFTTAHLSRISHSSVPCLPHIAPPRAIIASALSAGALPADQCRKVG